MSEKPQHFLLQIDRLIDWEPLAGLMQPASGGAANRVTDEYLDARQPVWAPDNRRVAFQGYADGVWHLYVMNADGGGLRMVTSGPFDDREPSWSRALTQGWPAFRWLR